jgi:hypothetical protein
MLMLAKSISLRWGLAVCLMLSSFISFAQRVVTGKVTGADNQPASGATVSVTGTNVATQTDPTGNFTISVPGGRSSLTITSIGFETQTVPVTNSGQVAVTLKIATSNLNEVVVTGYTAQRKKDVTGAVTVVNVEQMNRQPTGQVANQ